MICLLVLVLVISTDVGSLVSPSYDWAISCMQKYPGLVEDVQNIVSKEDISSGVDIILSILRIGSTVFLLSDLMMLSGVIMSSVH